MKNSPESYKKGVETRRRNGSYGMLKGRKRPVFSEEWCKNLSLGHKGKTVWNKGKKTGPLSQEHRNKISIANKGKPKPPFTDEHILKIKQKRALQIIPKRSEEHIQAMRIARSKQKLPMNDSKPERMMQIALSLNGVKFEKQKMIRDGMKFFHAVDIFIEPNICFEVDGDWIHANPDKYKPDDVVKNGKMAKEVWANDIRINHKLNLLGYDVIRIWESDIRRNAQDCAARIINLLRSQLGVKV